MASSNMKWIRGGRIVTAKDDFLGEVLIGDGKILAIGTNLKALTNTHTEEIDASGLLVMPGGVDPHTHLDLPFMGTSSADDFETGTIAAMCGGTTSIIDFVMQSHGQSLGAALNQWHEKAKGKAIIDYGFHMAVTDLNDKTEAEIKGLVDGGVTSFKAFMAYKGALMIDDGALFKFMLKAKELGALVALHCEHADLIDVLAKQFIQDGKTAPVYHELSHTAIGEGEATHRAATLSRVVGHPVYVVHLTCNEALQAVKDSLSRYRNPIFAETCTQYLVLDRSVYEKPGFEGAKWVMSPPLRTKDDQEALWAGLRDGFIQVVATDHCPFNFSGQKEMGLTSFAKIPNGAPGIENRLSLLYTYGVKTNRISINRFVELVSTNPAKIFGMYPRKGAIAPGADADILLFDPSRENTISVKTSKHRCDYSAFEGFKTSGEAVSVLVRGEWALKNGKVLARAGQGEFIRRSRFTGNSELVR